MPTYGYRDQVFKINYSIHMDIELKCSRLTIPYIWISRSSVQVNYSIQKLRSLNIIREISVHWTRQKKKRSKLCISALWLHLVAPLASAEKNIRGFFISVFEETFWLRCFFKKLAQTNMETVKQLLNFYLKFGDGDGLDRPNLCKVKKSRC